MARFRIEQPYTRIGYNLWDRPPEVSREQHLVWLNEQSAIELRDLLLKEFPVGPAEPAQKADTRKECTCNWRPCRGAAGLGEGWRCAREQLTTVKQPPAEPDVDEVRRALDDRDSGRFYHVDPINAAARAYLRMREQQPQQHPTIARVVEACGVWPQQQWIGVDVRMRQLKWEARPVAAVSSDFIPATADTPEAALRKLYADARARLERQRDEAIEKLAKLEVRS